MAPLSLNRSNSHLIIFKLQEEYKQTVIWLLYFVLVQGATSEFPFASFLESSCKAFHMKMTRIAREQTYTWPTFSYDQFRSKTRFDTGKSRLGIHP